MSLPDEITVIVLPAKSLLGRNAATLTTATVNTIPDGNFAMVIESISTN
jgi:hypothetical protein